MDAQTNQEITGEYDHTGDAIIYGDSVTGDTLIRTDGGVLTIAALFDTCPKRKNMGEREYGLYSRSLVVGITAQDMCPGFMRIKNVMRHKTTKTLYKVTLDNGKSVKVTQDHSLMVKRDGNLVEVKPTDVTVPSVGVAQVRL